MRADFKTLKRGILLLILIGVSLSYIQLIAMDQWEKFCNFRIRISKNTYYQGGFGRNRVGEEKLQAMQLTYIDYNESFANYNDGFDEKDGEEVETIDESEDDARFSNDTNIVDSEFTENSSEQNLISLSANKSNKFATIELKRFIQNETDFTTKPMMILFSTWEFSKEKAKVHTALMRMWNLWSSIKPLVMSGDPRVQDQSKRHGWYFKTLSKTNSYCFGPPVLSAMFTDVYKTHDAYFYGYSNADIIFGDGLEKTMKFIYYYFTPWKTKPVLIVGRRHNVDFIKYANFTLRKPEDVRAMTEVGQLVIRSTDYFFTNRHFPWGQAPRVSVGRPFVVRAIIGWALRRGFYVIDATNTIQSVHLTTQDGVFASWHKKGVMCNERVLAALRWTIPTAIGHCECARLETFHSEDGTIKLRHRPLNKKYCTRRRSVND